MDKLTELITITYEIFGEIISGEDLYSHLIAFGDVDFDRVQCAHRAWLCYEHKCPSVGDIAKIIGEVH